MQIDSNGLINKSGFGLVDAHHLYFSYLNKILNNNTNIINLNYI